jgi:hypothetical protein
VPLRRPYAGDISIHGTWPFGIRYLSANCSGRKPEPENQLRPLVGLTPEQAQTAWERAAEKASDRKTTAQMVKSAVKAKWELFPAVG